jgi:hypothetical protein
MVPRREGLRTICTFWNSSLFPAQAPADTVLMTSFVTGENIGDPMELSDGLLAQTVEAENAAVLGITVRRWTGWFGDVHARCHNTT